MITADQKLARANKIGSSDAAAILGLDPYRSASDVWLEKTGRADGFAGNEATERGNLLEPVLIRWAVGELAWNAGECFSSLMREHPSGRLIANLDAAKLIYDDGAREAAPVEIIEAKSTVMGEEWGENGTDQVPDRVNVQVHHQFVCVPSARVAWVPVLLPGYRSFDWRLYRVERNDKLAEIVERSGLDFMEKFVLPDIQPADFKPSLEVLKRVRREPNKIVLVADELLDNFIVARGFKKQAEEAYEAAQRELLTAMADAEGGEGTRAVATYMITKRKGYTVAETEYRSLRTKTKKGA